MDSPIQTINITQGEFRVTDDPRVVLATLLGSCIAVCLSDPVRGVGGMNHFLLPEDTTQGSQDVRYGAHAMELLINAMIKKGALRSRMVAKVFGGAKMYGHLRDIGQLNIQFARDFMAREGIACRGESLGGDQARRIMFWPVEFRARQRLVPRSAVDETPLVLAERSHGTEKVTLF